MMNQQEILRKIGHIIQELNDQQQYLSNTSKINLLELELFTANADFLIDHIEILKKLNSQGSETKVIEEQVETKAKEFFEEELVIEKVVVYPPDLIPDEEDEELEEIQEPREKPFFAFSLEEEPVEMVFDFEKKIPVEEVFDRELSEEEKEVLKAKSNFPEEVVPIIEEEEGPEPYLIIQEKEKEAVVEEEVFAEIIDEEAFIVEEEVVEEEEEEILIKENVKPTVVTIEPKMTLNDLLSSKKDQRMPSSNLGQKASIDLKTTISLNDKMIFIKELFSGYNLAYSEAIEILNRFESFDAADNFLLKNYAKKNNWENKQDVVDRFYEYLNRKF
ncbi:hypothetical protein [Pedobacter cryophilus]|uniref:Uncharacterized protein n=1 Tax=Pedobacter cryophilus TaxID=2571271 RepID=A0A4U1C0J7_9SPHI|nr:hypothetical protein [Pedobacter cryophilus]TKB98721.1 hypothetical protein FA046_06285 [Pedobacter cryophilus]